MKGRFLLTVHQNILHTLYDFLPKKLKKIYSPKKILVVNKHNIILTLFSKNSNQPFVLKILDKNYYNKALAKSLCHLPKTGLLLPVNRYFDSSYAYFVYPYFKTLSDTLLQGELPYPMLQCLINEIGEAIITLHKNNILHLDITPNNLFLDDKGHFYLGDFSSSCFVNNPIISCLCWKKSRLRTGTTPAFAPPKHLCPKENSFWHDQYSFAFLIYLLLHNGSTIQKENSQIISSFPSSCLVLQKAMEAPDSISKNMLENFLSKLNNALSKDEQLFDSQNHMIKIPDSQQKIFQSITPDCFIQKEPIPKEHVKLLSNRFNTSSIPVPLYGFLIFCGFLFIFSLYHYFAQNNQQTALSTYKNISLPTASVLPSSTIISNSPIASDKEAAPEKTDSQNSSDAPLFSEKPTAIPKQNYILDLSCSGYNNSDFLKQSNTYSSTKILFAGNCHFTNCTPFSSLTDLEELYLNNNPISSINALTRMSHLKILVLSNCGIKNISPVSKLNSLTILDLSQNYHLKGIRSLTSLKKLKLLIITNSNVMQEDVHFLRHKLPHCTILY